MKELKKALALADARKAVSDSFDEDTDEADEAYKAYWEAMREAAALIVKISKNQIDEKTALRMIVHKRGEISALITRAV
jgi:hypothetical protein